MSPSVIRTRVPCGLDGPQPYSCLPGLTVFYFHFNFLWCPGLNPGSKLSPDLCLLLLYLFEGGGIKVVSADSWAAGLLVQCEG